MPRRLMFRRRFLPCCMFALMALTFRPALAQQSHLGALQDLFGEPVTTSATGKPQRVSDVPADMVIITGEQIRRSGADNLPDILSFVPGLDVRRYGFAAADVGVRGYNETSNPRLLVLVDGQQVYLDDLGRTQWYTLPVALPEIRQIEIIKGPSSALYGFNAASGVINIVTYDPLHDEPINTVTVGSGTQGYTGLSAVATGRIGDKAGLRFFADGFNARDFDPIGVSPADQAYRQSPGRRAVGLNGKWQLTPTVELFASGALVNTRIWEATASPYFGTDFQRTNWSRVGLNADTSAGLLSISLYRNQLLYTYNGASEREDLNDSVYVLQTSDLMKIGTQHTLRVGIDYRNNFASSSDVVPGTVGYHVLSGSLMWDWQITPRVSLTNAVRFDHFTLYQKDGGLLPQSGLTPADFNGRSINEPSFNSGIVWRVTDADTARVLIGRGLQLPSIYDLGLQDQQFYPADALGDPAETFFALGNPHVSASVILNGELAWDHTFRAQGVHLHGAVFVQRTTNILTNPYEATPAYTTLADGSLFALAQAMNTGRSSAIGGEIGLAGKAYGINWNASYAFISISDDMSINQGGIYSPQDFAHGTPAHVVAIGASYAVGRWEFTGRARWQARFLDYRVNGTSNMLTPAWVNNYVTVDARVGYRLTPHLSVSVTGQQLNAVRLMQSGAPPVERRAFVQLTAGF